jgi:hypothetical protein
MESGSAKGQPHKEHEYRITQCQVLIATRSLYLDRAALDYGRYEETRVEKVKFISINRNLC